MLCCSINPIKPSISEEEVNNTFEIKSTNFIEIRRNSDFSKYATPGGNGTLNNPWIIEDRIVDNSSINTGIYIANTTNYFIITNCTLKSVNQNGIRFSNVTNGNITDCNFKNIEYGIDLSNVSNGNIINNNFTKTNYAITTEWEGIESMYIANNYCNASMIDITKGKNVTLRGNTIFDFGTGIEIHSSNHMKVSKNTIFEDDTGISIYFSTYIEVANNSVQYCTTGIYLDGADRNTLIYNTANHNSERGIFLENSDNNTLAHNQVNYNTKVNYAGIDLESSHNNTLNNNEVMHNNGVSWASVYLGSGIILHTSIDNVLRYNTIVNSSGSGICLDNSSRTKIIHNTITSNLKFGIDLYVSHYNFIDHNIITENSLWGIGDENWGWPWPDLFPLSAFNIITWNTIHDNGMGCMQVNETLNIIAHNNCGGGPGVPGFQWNITILVFMMVLFFQIFIIRKRTPITFYNKTI